MILFISYNKSNHRNVRTKEKKYKALLVIERLTDNLDLKLCGVERWKLAYRTLKINKIKRNFKGTLKDFFFISTETRKKRILRYIVHENEFAGHNYYYTKSLQALHINNTIFHINHKKYLKLHNLLVKKNDKM